MKYVSDLKSSLGEYKKELNDVIKNSNENQIQNNITIEQKVSEIKTLEQILKDYEKDISLKAKRIEDLETSSQEHIDMLEQNQKHISELEDMQNQYVNETSALKQDKIHERTESEGVILTLRKKLTEDSEQIEMYKKQVKEMNNSLLEAKSEFVQIGEQLKEKENNLKELSYIISEKLHEVEQLTEANIIVEKRLQDQSDMCRKLEEENLTKDEIISSSVAQQKQLTFEVVILSFFNSHHYIVKNISQA